MDVVLEQIPQCGQVGPMQVIHWAIRVGKGLDSVCYEFESEGVQIGSYTTCDNGFKLKTQHLGTTSKSHKEIKEWVRNFGQINKYHVMGVDFGGKNCQDFAVDLCQFLGVDLSQLPWRQAKQVEAAVGGAFIATTVVALGAGLLAKILCPGEKADRRQELRVLEMNRQQDEQKSQACVPGVFWS